MKGLTLGLLTGAALTLALATAPANAQHAGAQMNLGQPDYERSIGPGEEATLAHTKSPAMHTVCASKHNTNRAIIRYDNNEMVIGSGDCVRVEASYLQASPEGDERVNVFGWHIHDLRGARHGG